MEIRSLYTLEEKIMAAWSVVDDIKLLAETQSNRRMSEDELANFLLGMQTIANVKFESLFSEYEKLLAEEHRINLKRKSLHIDDEGAYE